MKTLSKALCAAIVIVTVIVMTPLAEPAHACVQPYVGDICTFAFNFCPQGFLQANGQLLPIFQYSDLFNLIGTTYGGDGQTTFAVPNLQGSAAVGTGQGAGLPNVFLGEAAGSTNTVSVLPRPGRPPVLANQLPSLSLTSCIAWAGVYPQPQ